MGQEDSMPWAVSINEARALPSAARLVSSAVAANLSGRLVSAKTESISEMTSDAAKQYIQQGKSLVEPYDLAPPRSESPGGLGLAVPGQ